MPQKIIVKDELMGHKDNQQYNTTGLLIFKILCDNIIKIKWIKKLKFKYIFF